MKSSGGGGHSLPKQLWISQSQWRKTSAGAFFFPRKKEWKARRASAYESCGNKYKSVSPAVTDIWVSPLPLQLYFFTMRPRPGGVRMWVCMSAYDRCVKINRLKRETVGLTGQDFRLCVHDSGFVHDSLTEGEVKTGGGAKCVCLHVCWGEFLHAASLGKTGCCHGLQYRLTRLLT